MRIKIIRVTGACAAPSIRVSRGEMRRRGVRDLEIRLTHIRGMEGCLAGR